MCRPVTVLLHSLALSVATGIVTCCVLNVSVLASEAEIDAVREASEVMWGFYEKGDIEKAATSAEEYTRLLEQTFGRGANDTARGYAFQSRFYAELRSREKALKARDAALQILAVTQSPRPEIDAMTLHLLALCSAYLGDGGMAVKCGLREGELIRKGDGDVPEELPTFFSDLATIAFAEGRRWDAAQCQVFALWAANKVFGERSEERRHVLDKCADLYEAQCLYENAVALHQEMLVAIEGEFGPTAIATAQRLRKLANCQELLGDFAAAESTARRALAIMAGGPNPDVLDMVLCLNIIARACAQQGKWEEAERNAREALAVLDEGSDADRPALIETRQSLMLSYTLQGRYQDAERLARESLAAIEKSAGSRNPEYIPTLSALGYLFWSTGKHEEADKLFVRAIAACKRESKGSSPLLALLEQNHAANCFYQGRYAEAEKISERSLRSLQATLGDDHPRVAALFINLGTAQASQGKWAEAASNNDQGCRRMVPDIRHQLDVLPPVEQFRLLRGQYAIAYQAALTMGLVQQDDHRMCELSAGWLANGKAIAHEASRRQAAQAKSNAGESDSDTRALTEPHPWVEIDAIRARIPPKGVFIDIARFDVFNYAATRKGEDWKPARYAAWIVPARGVGSIQVVDLGDAKPIDAAVATYRQALREAVGENGRVATSGEPAAEQALLRTAGPLVERVLRPILAGVSAAGCAAAEQLIISPDGELWMVPWAAMPLSDGRYLVEQYAISTLTSGRDLDPVQTARSECSRSVIVADPAFDMSPNELAQAIQALDVEKASSIELPQRVAAAAGAGRRSVQEIGRAARLPWSLSEARQVAKRIERLCGERPVMYLEGRALEERVKQLRSPRILHFATHGFVLPDQVVSTARVERLSMLNSAGRPIQGLTSEAGEPLEDPLLRCGLLLAGCNAAPGTHPEGAGDGCLTGQEIVALDLSSTELVVLSACDTGAGRVQHGEGVAGLRQAFLIAGAEAVLATLWQVSDELAADLVVKFFDRLAAGEGRTAALRHAQLDLIATRRKERGAAHPAAWAAFELTGR